jgi:hypothetical protein
MSFASTDGFQSDEDRSVDHNMDSNVDNSMIPPLTKPILTRGV